MENTTMNPFFDEDKDKALLQKIQQLELAYAHLKQEISNLIARKNIASNSSTKQTSRRSSPELSDNQCYNILQSMGQAVHVIDRNLIIIYWGCAAENLYGYLASEALGCNVVELLTDSQHYSSAKNILRRVETGENWTGVFPATHKRGESLSIVVTETPLYDDTGALIGVVCVSSDLNALNEEKCGLSSFYIHQSDAATEVECNDYLRLCQLPLQRLVASIVSKLVSVFSNDRDRIEERSKFEHHGTKAAGSNDNALGSCFSSLVDTTSSYGSCGSAGSGAVKNIDSNGEFLDYEILWEDLTIGEQIARGSCEIVHRALWHGTDVAVKMFSDAESSDNAVLSFCRELSLTGRLRHPNILLFMGAVVSPEHLCIVTEYLPRGSLFRLLQRTSSKLDKRQRVHMALDIARGMTYLHNLSPPIIHSNLKSSNLLVDKNWTVKVGNFGRSCLKNDSYSTTKKGTPQWMAPEVLRNEPSDEKADVYSFGVILWELVTHRIPWDHLNSMQVIGVVGFMNQHLQIPKDVEPQWRHIIESCWHSDPKWRPSFQELVEKLNAMHQECATIQAHAGCAVDGNTNG
ncbi:serine/threonine-protein kinase EDR1-like [Andrographis paniculata]|uniref:serine/threonine-protein kinase EDR1-like n=1 Tax=Andrographis paniculata TaxID=175694 RepID=UPI0021E77AC2|nr:serine/threonine-protein kinase EDR1-like [Andrographis paniculata]